MFEMMKKKKGAVSGGASKIITIVLSAVILMEFARYLYPVLRFALQNLSADLTGYPLIGLFAATGLIALLAMAALFFGVYKLFGKMIGGR